MGDEDATAVTAAGADDDGVVELQVALVCYGGVSLAVYMHGITKGLGKLVLASAQQEGRAPADDGGADTERVYAELLAEVARSARTSQLGGDRTRPPARTRVVVDVVAGTSAGGINGVALARALAGDRSQSEIRDLWLRHGDIGELVQRGWPWLANEVAPELAKHWSGLADLLGMPRDDRDGDANGDGDGGLLARVAGRVGEAGATIRSIVGGVDDAVAQLGDFDDLPPSLLRGEVLSRRIHGALAGMDRRTGAAATLMPEHHDLELFVTMTDYAGVIRFVPISGQVVSDVRHRHVVEFRKTDARNDFEHVDLLAFAGRATASFPAAFRPISLLGFAEDVGLRTDWADDIDRFFRNYCLEGLDRDDVRHRLFVDGGVLNNKPFDHAIGAIRRRRANHEVRRCLVYVEPDPNDRKPDDATALRTKDPSAVRTFLRSTSSIPLEQSIYEQILQVREQNERAQRLAEVVREREASATARPAAAADDPVYGRLRTRQVVDAVAAIAARMARFPAESNHAFFVREVLRCWARDRGFYGEDGDGTLTPAAAEFLAAFDVDYARRRLRFVIDGVSNLYRYVGDPEYPRRRELDAAKAALYAHVARLDDVVPRLADDAEFERTAIAPFDEARIRRQLLDDTGWALGEGLEWLARDERLQVLRDELASRIRKQLDDRPLADFTAAAFEEFRAEHVGSWGSRPPAPARDRLLARFGEFAWWDVVTYPIRLMSDVGERDIVEVIRVSPRETRLLPDPPGRSSKLRGASVHHFGAFFSRAWREEDYLWGRLDGAEQLVRMVAQDVADPAVRERIVERYARAALAAIVEAEVGELDETGDLVEWVRGALAAMVDPATA
jgi:patatin-related protein